MGLPETWIAVVNQPGIGLPDKASGKYS